MDTTGSLIRAERERIGWTQVELATHAGTDRSTVSRAETGARQAATLSLLSMVKFARALGMTVDELVGDDVESSEVAS
ncbi:MAG: helix-turn-helix domain-containing protein [Actinomycetota bacterium]|nr:helix-turn-helix domain-containing protein [Actinomycetota bacterium]